MFFCHKYMHTDLDCKIGNGGYSINFSFLKLSKEITQFLYNYELQTNQLILNIDWLMFNVTFNESSRWDKNLVKLL